MPMLVHAGGRHGVTAVRPQEARAAEALLRLSVMLVGAGTREVGLTASLTLADLYWNGQRRLTDLARAQHVSQPSMSGVVTSLGRMGMVERHPDPDDRRAVVVSILDRGVDYLEHRRNIAVRMLGGLIEALPGTERAALLAAVPVLERMIGGEPGCRRLREE